MFTVEDVVRGTQGALVGGDLGVPVSGVSIDTRTLPVGAAFFAIKGQNDGHHYLKDATTRGAACLVVHTLPDDLPATVAVVLVGVARAGAGAGAHVAMPDRQAAIHDALGWARGGDVVVIAGKGHETYQIVGSSVLPFDDRAVARAFLERAP